MHPPERDELAENPIKEMTGEELSYSKNVYIFEGPGNNPLPIPTEIQDWFGDHGRQIHRAALEIRRYGLSKEYDQHTDLLHDYWRHPDILQDYFICKNKAFLKMREILREIRFESPSERGPMRSFHLCEGPGYFIDAVYMALLEERRGTEEDIKNKLWEWGANTLNPYFENESCFKKLIDDSHIREHRDRWFFGPSDDGDVKKLTEDYLIKNELAGSFDLVTADGSTDTQGQEGQIEEVVASLIRAEVEAALILLRKNGRLILKVYRFCALDTQDVMMLLADNFGSIRVFKPKASRPGSSEKYVICEGFGEKMSLDVGELFRCDEFFVSKQSDRMRMHVKSFVEKSVPYTWEDRKTYIQEMKDRYYTAARHKFRGALNRLFPSGTLKPPSPWLKMYGHNLVRRLHEANIDKAIEQHVQAAEASDRLPRVHRESSEIIADIMSAKVMCVTSDIPLIVKDSLFLEPITHVACQRRQPDCYDLFEKVSTINRDLGDDWRKHLEKIDHRWTLKLVPGITIEHILMAMAELYDDGETFIFRIANVPCDKPPLFLSRLSASMQILIELIFDDYSMTAECCVEFSDMHSYHDDDVRRVFTRLLAEIAELPCGTSLRCFVPIELLDYYHPFVCYRNWLNLESIYENVLYFRPERDWPLVDQLMAEAANVNTL
ncbi:hypothetical protein CRE_02812 [Caenorhabditis remanei]|uniref:Cap-specific mRNA (nucleoside-2'-O-)-methyltransferase 2 n=1 Tax=Caenorhabditis remanei TaxID=31234 RepID=E3LX45_CAERE|nr:hypothetical protein CRE_02812 [Caenorhabditis remanei]